MEDELSEEMPEIDHLGYCMCAGECVICTTNAAVVMADPCGHVSLCETCLVQLTDSKCILDRTDVDFNMRVKRRKRKTLGEGWSP